jgi:hypothetical protein
LKNGWWYFQRNGTNFAAASDANRNWSLEAITFAMEKNRESSRYMGTTSNNLVLKDFKWMNKQHTWFEWKPSERDDFKSSSHAGYKFEGDTLRLWDTRS